MINSQLSTQFLWIEIMKMNLFSRGNDYEQHTKCISEEQKYSGKNYVPKANANKNEIKQELWFQVCKTFDTSYFHR